METLFFILVILTILYIFAVASGPCIEGMDNTYGGHCRSCDNKSFGQCMNCSNCGFCVDKDGVGKCVSGDMFGPWDKSKCVNYYHNDPYWRNVWTSNTRVYPATDLTGNCSYRI